MEEQQTGFIYDIQKFSTNDGPGIRTTIFLKGCPLRCIWCHSPESQSFGNELMYMDARCIGTTDCGACIGACPQDAICEASKVAAPAEYKRIVIDRSKCDRCYVCTAACHSRALLQSMRVVTVNDCVDQVKQDWRYYETSGGGATISGGEPMAQFDFTLELARAIRWEGFTVALDTTGFAPWEHFEQIAPYVNLFLYDLKCMDSDRHKELTGVPNELILDNARRLADAGARFQMRIPVITGYNDSRENIEQAAAFCEELRDSIDLVQLLPFHKLGTVKYARLGLVNPTEGVEPPSVGFMEECKQLFVDRGLSVVIH